MAKEEKDLREEVWKELLDKYREETLTEQLGILREELSKIVDAELAKRGKESLDDLEEGEIEDFAKISLDKLERRLATKQFKAELKEEMKPKAVGARFLRWMLVGIAAAIFFGLIGLLMSSC